MQVPEASNVEGAYSQLNRNSGKLGEFDRPWPQPSGIRRGFRAKTAAREGKCGKSKGPEFTFQLSRYRVCTYRAAWLVKRSYRHMGQLMNNLKQACFFVFLLIGSQLSLASAADDPELRRRFLEEAPGKWNEYIQAMQGFQGILHPVHRDLTTNKVVWRSQTLLKQRPGCELNIRQQFEPETRGVVCGYNPKYYFFLYRHRPDGGWIVDEHVDQVNREETDYGEKRDGYSVIQNLCANLTLGNSKWLPELMKDPSFSITSIHSISHEGQDAVAVQIDYPPRIQNKIIRSGRIILLPDAFWTIATADITTEGYDGRKGRYLHTYRVVPTGTQRLPVLRQVILRRGRGEGDVKFEYEIVSNYDLHDEPIPPESDFTLAAFGLPESAVAQSSATPSYYYLCAAVFGIACLIMAWWIKHRKRTPAGPSHHLSDFLV
jgi:hypothetical protein